MACVDRITMQEYIKIFNGYRHAYGIADWTNAVVDPESGKKKPVYRWNYEEFTDVIYQEHLEGNISVGIQPTNCLLYTSPSPRDGLLSRMPSSA